MNWTIRRWLTLWNTLALSVLLIGMALLTYVLMVRELNEFMVSTAEANHILEMLRTVLFVSVPMMLVLAGGAAYWLAGRALAPVSALDRATRNITAQSLDQRLAVANPNDELGRLTATINDMLARLERSFVEMRRFTADASHELRTPLAVMRVEVEQALAKPLAHDQVQEVLVSVLEECDRLTKLTEQLLALARRDAKSAMQRHETIEMDALVAGVVETLRPLAEAKELALQCSGVKACVRGDPDQLRQALINLIDNAIKYTANGSVRVSVEECEDAVVVRIVDTGEGIAAEHLPRVFERFYRVDKARAREMGGTGLGLSIARSIVEAQRGAIEIASETGRGTVCTIRLPRGNTNLMEDRA